MFRDFRDNLKVVFLTALITLTCVGVSFGGWRAYWHLRWYDTALYQREQDTRAIVNYLNWLIQTGRLPPPQAQTPPSVSPPVEAPLPTEK